MNHDSSETSLTEILVVEDDSHISGPLEQVLQREGFSVTVVDTGSDALRHCRASAPEIVLLDYELPDMNGASICQIIHEETDAYIVMLTGRSSETDKIVSLMVGADDYVTKPFSYGELTARLRALQRRRRGSRTVSPQDERRVFGKLVIRPLYHEVLYDGNPVELTRTEFDLLDHLSRQPGDVITRSDLLRKVWTTDWNENDHLLNVHIHNLRRKLRNAGESKNIVITVRGVGFRFSSAND